MKLLVILVIIIIVLILVLVIQNEITRRAIVKNKPTGILTQIGTTAQSQLGDLLASALATFGSNGGSSGLSKTDMIDAMQQALQWSADNLQQPVIATQGGTWTVDLSVATLNALQTRFENALGNSLVDVNIQGGNVVATLDSATLAALENISVDVTGLIPLTIAGYDQAALNQLATIFPSNQTVTLSPATIAALQGLDVDATIVNTINANLTPATIASIVSQLQGLTTNTTVTNPISLAAATIAALVAQMQGLNTNATITNTLTTNITPASISALAAALNNLNVNATVTGPVTIAAASISAIASAMAGETFNVNVTGQPLTITGTVDLGDISALTNWLLANNLNINDTGIINAINTFRDATKAVNVTKTEICYTSQLSGTDVYKGYEYEMFYSDGSSSIVAKDIGKNILTPGTYALVDCACNSTCLFQKARLQCDWYTFDAPFYTYKVGPGGWKSDYPISTGEGWIYEVNSFIIDGVEQLSSLFHYTILNPGQTATYPPYADEGILIWTTGDPYIANFNLIFGNLFKFLNLEANWQCILNPVGGGDGRGKVVRFIFPNDVSTWSITVVRHDGIEFQYTSDGLLARTDGSWNSDMSGYTFCRDPPTEVRTVGPMKCQYLCWDRARADNQQSAAPFTWQIPNFSINGIPMLTVPFVRTINLVDIVLAPDPSYTLNNQIFLNEMFILLGLYPSWKAETTGLNTFNLTYPGNVQEFVMTVIRNTGQITYYRQEGHTSTFDGFVGENAYGLRCEVLGSKKSGRNQVTSSWNSEIQAKKYKLTTPLTIPPPKKNGDIVGILRKRLETIRTRLRKKLETSKFRMCLFGSQIKGFSASGNPDIDLWIVPTTSTAFPDKRTMDRILTQLKSDLDFQLDVTVLQPETLKRMEFVEFK